jgi:hypothetical protein
MSDARRNRGMGNDLAKWVNAPIWDSITKPVTDGCKHNKISFKPDGKECKECGVKL